MYLLTLWFPRRARISCLFGGRYLGRRGARLVSLCCILRRTLCRGVVRTECVLQEQPRIVDLGTFWFLDRSWCFTFDRLSRTLLFVVCRVSCCVHVYAVWYLGQDPHLVSFLGIFGGFTLSMMVLVGASNLILLFLGWEGVGICSFGLIGFWHRRREAARGRLKRVVYNRIGDVRFMLGLGWLRLERGTVDTRLIERLHTGTSGGQGPMILFLIRRRAKSAQLPLHGWLADAMEGPTPVSALLHAATMVVAGVFTLCRLGYLRGDEASGHLAELGAITRLARRIMGATSMDRKAVIAYSTCSQLGYMLIGVGRGVVGCGLSHLFLHRRFKAALFLRAGVRLHSISDEQDLRNSGGLGGVLPVTRIVLWVNSRSLMGLPYLSGWVSKDTMLEYLRARQSRPWQGALGVICLGGTAFYRAKSLGRVARGAISVSKSAVGGIREAPLLIQRFMMILCGRRVCGGVLTRDFNRSLETTEGWSSLIWVDAQRRDQMFIREHQSRWAPVRLWILLWIVACARIGFLWRTQWWLSIHLWYNSSLYRGFHKLGNLRLMMDRFGGILSEEVLKSVWSTLFKGLEQGSLNYTFHKALPTAMAKAHQTKKAGLVAGYRFVVALGAVLCVCARILLVPVSSSCCGPCYLCSPRHGWTRNKEKRKGR